MPREEEGETGVKNNEADRSPAESVINREGE